MFIIFDKYTEFWWKMKFEVGKLYHLVSSTIDTDRATCELYPDEALITVEHEGKRLADCFIKEIVWNFKNGPFLVVANNNGSKQDTDFYRIISSEGTTGWIRLPAYLGCEFEELKCDEE